MACSCTTNTCNQCACTYPSNTSCITWKGSSISCGDVVIATQGDVLTDILTNITDLACGNITPSGEISIVEGVTNQTTVTSSVSGNETTYTVGLASAITTTISNHTSNIASINACLSNTVADIISDTLTITEDSSNSCGRTLKLEYTPSGSITTFDGIIYNDLNKSGTSGAAGDKILKSFTTDYTDYNFTEGDEIRFKSNGQILGDGDSVDSVKFEVFDVNAATLLYSEEFSGFDRVNKQSWKLEGDITYTDITSGEVSINIDFFGNSLQNGNVSTLTKVSQMVVNSIFNISDFTNLRLRLVYNHQSTSTSTNNFARQFLVEIRKKI